MPRKGGAVPRKSKTKSKLTGYCESKELAELFDVTVRRVQQLTQDGILFTYETSEGRRYDTKENIKAYVKYLSDKAYGREKSRDEEQLRLQKLEMEVAWKEAQTELQTLRKGILSKEYIPVDEVRSEYIRLYSDFKKFALSIPDKLVKRISGRFETDERKELKNDMKKTIENMLRDYALNVEVEKDAEAETREASGN